MRTRSNRWWTLLILLGCFVFVGSTLTGCKKEEGAAEDAGEQIDEATEEAQDQADDAAEDAEDAMDEAIGGHGGG